MAFGGGRGRWLGIPWLLGGRPRILRHPRGPRSKSLPCDARAMSGRTGGAPASDTHGCATKHGAVPSERSISSPRIAAVLRRTTEFSVVPPRAAPNSKSMADRASKARFSSVSSGTIWRSTRRGGSKASRGALQHTSSEQSFTIGSTRTASQDTGKLVRAARRHEGGAIEFGHATNPGRRS